MWILSFDSNNTKAFCDTICINILKLRSKLVVVLICICYLLCLRCLGSEVDLTFETLLLNKIPLTPHPYGAQD